MVKCVICNKEFELEKQLHAHLKAHKMRMAEYYQTHFPRKDLYSGDLIKFKSKDYYMSTDFNSRTNMKKWLSSVSEDKAKRYVSKIFKERIKRKKTQTAPTQVELRTVSSPPVQYFQELFGNYHNFCEESGLKKRYSSYPKENCFSACDYSKTKDLKIYVDTREQYPFQLDFPTESKGLKYGDYALSDGEICCNCHIERKSIKDFIGTFSGGLERFRREIDRSVEAEAYLVVLVESTISKCMAFDKLPYVSKKVQATPEYIFRNVRDIYQDYDNIQFLFVDGRKEAVRVMKRIFFCGCSYMDYDLQLAYDLKYL